MDENLKEVLLAVIALISAIVTPLIVLYVSIKQSKKLNTVESKLDENHKLVNGHLSALLQTTKDLATATERARAKAETKTHKS